MTEEVHARRRTQVFGRRERMPAPAGLRSRSRSCLRSSPLSRNVVFESKPRRVLLVSSSGGVLLDLLSLAPWWSRHDATWAVVRATDTESALTGENVQWINECHAAQPLRLLRGLGAARRLIRRVDPDVIISAGSGAAVPFFLAGRALGV